MMLLKVKVQFNGCFCMQTRLSVELLIKMMLCSMRIYMVFPHMRVTAPDSSCEVLETELVI